MKIRYLVMDVDGTLTDGKIYMGPEGEAMKAFNIKDGYGIHDMLPRAGITPVIITGRKSAIVENRGKELGISEIHQGVKDKVLKLREVCGDPGCTAYIGDDSNDLPSMEAVRAAGGKTGCPADAVRAVKETADFVSEFRGGDGAVRDFIEWLIAGADPNPGSGPDNES